MSHAFERGAGPVWGGGRVPEVEEDETDDAHVVRAELSGIPRENVPVDVDDHEPKISGEPTAGQQGRGISRRTGRCFHRTSLPSRVDGEKVEAEPTDRHPHGPAAEERYLRATPDLHRRQGVAAREHERGPGDKPESTKTSGRSWSDADAADGPAGAVPARRAGAGPARRGAADQACEQVHLPGALHISLRGLDQQAPERLNADRPVIVYCVDQPIGAALDMLEEIGRRVCVVSDAGQVVVGLLRHRDAAACSEGTVEDAMRPGPATVRADESLVPLLERRTRAGSDAVPVNDPEGRLVGLLEREDLEGAVVRASAGAAPRTSRT
ncbi:CBS domain-containing protein [Streptomyces sp. GLT-R25]